MAAKTPEDRLDRLEAIVQILAEDQQSLTRIVADLAAETRKGFAQVTEQFALSDRRMTRLEEQMRETDQHMRQTDERMRQTDERMRQTDERMRQTDERLDKLVSVIGESIRRGN